MKKFFALSLFLASFSSYGITLKCDNSSVKGSYTAKFLGIKDGNSITGESNLTFDGLVDSNGRGKFEYSGFDTQYGGIKYDVNKKTGFIDLKGTYRVYEEGCWVSLIVAENTGDEIGVSMHLIDMSTSKKPYTANKGIGAFKRDGIGYTFEMERWIKSK